MTDFYVLKHPFDISQDAASKPEKNGHVQTNGQAKHHHVPLTKCHLQRLDTRRGECYQEESFKYGFCHYEGNGGMSFKKDAKER